MLPNSNLRKALAEKDSVTAVCFSHDGKYLATGSSDRSVYVSLLSSKTSSRLLILSYRSGIYRQNTYGTLLKDTRI
jgi:WD40 repeat protein